MAFTKVGISVIDYNKHPPKFSGLKTITFYCVIGSWVVLLLHSFTVVIRVVAFS